MATNRVFATGRVLTLAASDPATPTSGNPVLVGQLPGVAVNDEAADGTTVIDTGGVYSLAVQAVDAGGNSAVAPGDILYYVAADTPKLSKKNTGVRFGYALEAIGAGQTATILVKLGY